MMTFFEYFRFRTFACLLFICVSILINICSSSAVISLLTPFASVKKADVDSEIILPCNVSGKPQPSISWLKNGRLLSVNSSKGPLQKDNKGLLFHNLLASDAGNYTCIANNLYDLKEFTTELIVRTPPGKLTNVTVHASTVVATIRWHVENDGGYPIDKFTLLYKPSKGNKSGEWHSPEPIDYISPAVRQLFIYQLRPGVEYIFRIWARNKLGKGKATIVYATTCKPVDPPEVFGKMLENADDFATIASMLCLCMITVLILSLALVFCFIVSWNRNGTPEESLTRIITNPGFEIDLEQYYLLEHADFNDNIEKPVRLNNNTVILPSRV